MRKARMTKKMLAAAAATMFAVSSVAIVASAQEPGGENPGGENPGGENPGGENPGGENPGGENPGGENPGGENPGGENPGGENPGGENPGGENSGDNSTSTSTPAATNDPTDISAIDEDGVEIGAGVTAVLSDKDLEKFGDDFNISATTVYVAAGDTDKDGNVLVSADANVVKDLNKKLKKEIAKIKKSEFKIINIDLADGSYVESTAPVAIKFTVNVPFEAKVYHVNGENVELLKSNFRKKTDGTYDVSFSTKTFSPFIFTTADLKNAKATTKDNDPTDASDAADGSTNPATGIALAIAPVVLAAGAVAVVALKKKH